MEFARLNATRRVVCHKQNTDEGKLGRTFTGKVFRRIADALTILIAVTIGYLTLSQMHETSMPSVWDKAAHAIAFFALVFPVVLAHRWGWLWIIPLAAGFGWAIEVIQPYFGRGKEIEDFYADLIGIGAGTISASLIRMFRRR